MPTVLPPLPAENEDPWYAKRAAWDAAVEAKVESLPDAFQVVGDATPAVKGILQLAGDLAGTAAAPTVPGLAGKAPLAHTHTAADVVSGLLAAARIGTGAPDGSKFLRDDQVWAAPPAGPGGGDTSTNAAPVLGIPVSVPIGGYLGLPATSLNRGNGGVWPQTERYAYPFAISGDFTADRLMINVATAAAGSFRFALYGSSPNRSRPDVLIQDYGLFDTGVSATVEKTIDQPLVGGTLYWLAWGALSGAASWAVSPTDWPLLSTGPWNEAVNPSVTRAAVKVPGAATDPFPAAWPAGGVNVGANLIAVGWRRSA